VKPVLALSTRWWHVLLIRFADRTAKGIRGAPRDVLLDMVGAIFFQIAIAIWLQSRGATQGK
jgi:hypothetical protein